MSVLHLREAGDQASPWSRFIDTLVDTIVLFRDHFLLRRQITLSESFLFLFSFVRSLWFSIYGVRLAQDSAVGTHEIWMPIFWALTLGHLVSFFLRHIPHRAIFVLAYAFVWGVLAILLALTSPESPAVPTFSLFALVAVVLVVRLRREGDVP